MKSLAIVLCIALAGILLGVSAASAQGLEALGDKTDLIYSPVVPCRIIDTRPAGQTAFGAGETRSYNVYGTVSDQNGYVVSPNPEKCPAPNGEPRAVAINIAAVPGSGTGHLRVWPADPAVGIPQASMLSFTAHQNNQNQGAVKTWSRNASQPDIRIYASAPTDVVVDVVGYYYDVEALFVDEDFNSGPAPNQLHVGPHLDFLAPVAVVEVTRNNQKIFVDSTNLFCSSFPQSWWDNYEASDLTLYICWEDVDNPNVLTTVGAGMGDFPPNGVRNAQIDPFQGIPMGMSAFIYDLPRGKYNVGLCGASPRDWQQWNQCHGPRGYTTAFVVPTY
jgi:hypothetical protein